MRDLAEITSDPLQSLDASIEDALRVYEHVTPGAVLSALRRVLYPLLSESEQNPLRKIRRASWWNLYWLFPAYAFMAGPQSYRLQLIASAIQRTVTAYADPHVIDGLPVHQEVGAFRQMRDQMGIPLPDICQFDERGHSWLYRFCRYCWRRALPSGLLCPVHSPAKRAGNNASYQEGRRMHREFNAEIVRILTQDALEFHAQDMSPSVLCWPEDLAGWLLQYRPRVAGWLGISRVSVLTESQNPAALWCLIARLQEAPDAGVRTQTERSAADNAFCESPELLWPVWVRAEAWLEVRYRRHARWGGARVHSGSNL